MHWQDREAWIYSKETYTRYPFQGSLYGLPPQVIKECIVGAIEARYGGLKQEPAKAADCTAKAASSNGNGAAANHRAYGNGQAKHFCFVVCCGDGVLESTARLIAAKGNGHASGNGHAGNAAPQNFEEFIYKVWGAGIAKH